MNKRLPGISEVYAVKATDIPQNMGLIADNTHVLPTLQSNLIRLGSVGNGGTATITETSKQLVKIQTVEVNFTIPKRVIIDAKSCFVVRLADGGAYLVGTREAVPEFNQSDTVDAPGSKTANECSISITGVNVWIPINAVTMSQAEEAEAILHGQITELVEATEEQIDDIINSIGKEE